MKTKKIILSIALIVMCVMILITASGCSFILFSSIGSLVNRDWAEVTKDGICYFISKMSSDAAVMYFESDRTLGDGELQRCVIPETVRYRGRNYPVTEIGRYSYNDYSIIKGSAKIGELVLPRTMEYVSLQYYNDLDTLKSITVDEYNGRYASVDGVLFSLNKLYMKYYPLGKTDETYTLPRQFEQVDNDARFWDNRYLQNLNIEEGSKLYSSHDGVLYSADGSKLMMYPSGRRAETFTAPQDMKCISLDSHFWNNRYITKVASVEGGYLQAVDNALYTHDGSELVFRPSANGKTFAIPSTVSVVSYNSLPGVENLHVPSSVIVFLDTLVDSSYPFNRISHIYFESDELPRYLQQQPFSGQLRFGVTREAFDSLTDTL